MERNITKTEKLLVIVRDRNTLIFQGHVEAVSSFNDMGPFDVLPRHANLISLIKQAIILHLTDKTKKRIEITSGVLKVRENKIEVYLGILL